MDLLYENETTMDLSKKLRPNTFQAASVLRKGKVKTFPAVPAVRRYAYEKGIDVDELEEVAANYQQMTKFDIDRYLKRKKIFAKQQIISKMRNSIDKAAMEKALLDVDETSVASERVVFEELNETNETIIPLDLVESKESVDVEKLFLEENNRITPMALAMIKTESINPELLLASKQNNEQIGIEDVKNWLNRDQHRTEKIEKISPLAQKMANYAGIENIDFLTGSGPKGQITSLDIYQWLKKHPQEKEEYNSEQFDEADQVIEKISFLARQMILKDEIDIESIMPGSGPKGQVTSIDVFKWQRMHSDEPNDEKKEHHLSISDENEENDLVSELAEETTETKNNLMNHNDRTTHFIFSETDITKTIDKDNGEIDPINYIVYSLCYALKKCPELNVKFDNEKYHVSQNINIAISQDFSKIFNYSVINDCDHIPLKELPKKMESTNDFSNPTFLLIDVGKTPVRGMSVYLPKKFGTVMTVGAPNKISSGKVMMPVSLTYDTDLGDMTVGARFIKELEKYLNQLV